MACVPSEDSDQPGHPPSLIRVFAVRMKNVWVLSYLLSASEDSDQNGRMPRLIWVFAGRTCHFVGFVVHWLMCDILFCHYLFLISPPFGSLRRLCFVIVTFPGYLHLHVSIQITKQAFERNHRTLTPCLGSRWTLNVLMWYLTIIWSGYWVSSFVNWIQVHSSEIARQNQQTTN